MCKEDEEIETLLDGDQWCARRADFSNLQECLAGFGETEQAAIEDLIKKEREE